MKQMINRLLILLFTLPSISLAQNYEKKIISADVAMLASYFSRIEILKKESKVYMQALLCAVRTSISQGKYNATIEAEESCETVMDMGIVQAFEKKGYMVEYEKKEYAAIHRCDVTLFWGKEIK